MSHFVLYITYMYICTYKSICYLFIWCLFFIIITAYCYIELRFGCCDTNVSVCGTNKEILILIHCVLTVNILFLHYIHLIALVARYLLVIRAKALHFWINLFFFISNQIKILTPVIRNMHLVLCQPVSVYVWFTFYFLLFDFNFAVR